MLLLISVMLLGAGASPGFAHAAPAHAKANEPLQVEGSLTGSGDFSQIVLLYRGPGQDYVEAKMEQPYGDLWRGTIPAARMVPPGVEYYVEGRTKKGERVPLFMTARKPARVIVFSADAGARL